MRHESTIGPPDAGRRLDRFVRTLLGDVPMSLVQRLIRTGQVRVDGKRCGQAGTTLELGQTVVVHHTPRHPGSPRPAPTGLPYQGPPIPVLHHDADFLAVNKPPHVACSEDGTQRANLPAWVRGILAEEIVAGRARPSLCHRLDRGTTGVVVFGLTAAAVSAFHRALADGTVEKRYWVAVWGRPRDRFEIRVPLQRLGRTPPGRPKVVAAGDDGPSQSACTRLRVLARGPTATLLEAVPLTGRTHQIRAHLIIAGWPVVGDPRYGDPARDRAEGVHHLLDHQLLHARSIRLPLVGGTGAGAGSSLPPSPVVRAQPPTEATRVLKRLGLATSLEADPSPGSSPGT